ncbi:MAG TPA: GGDEF domain-containing protein [Solirubrobacteraceae bacterium]|nr:GGDEF domain-containing protein [Solirubrobacteraceae bacterium]
MPAEHPLVGADNPADANRRAREAAQRQLIGRVAGALILVSEVVAVVAARILSHRHLPWGFDVLLGIGVVSGMACLLIPWARLDARWLNAIPILVTVELALAIRLGGFYGDIAANYYVFVAVFAGYAFTSRWVVAGHVALASVASALVLVYRHQPGSETAARVAVTILMIVAVGAVVTLLREGLEKRQRELEELALRDPLTGVGNYRLLAERLEYELARHRRSGASLTVVLLDLNGFKQVNDTHGHLAGDRVLVDVAQALRTALRSQDTLARQGGDEFSILAPEMDSEQVHHLVRRVHEALVAGVDGSLTTSVGWATFPDDGADADALLNLADADLRRAKRTPAPRREKRDAQPLMVPVTESG